MNTTTRALALAVTTLLALSPVRAQEAPSRLYAELGYTEFHFETRDPNLRAKFSPALGSGTLGYQLMPNMAVEGMLGYSKALARVTVTANGATVPNNARARIRDTVGVFLKPSFAVHDHVDLFARVGWVQHTLIVMVPGASAKQSDESLAYGVGANVNLTKATYLQASWMSYYRKNRTGPSGTERTKLDGVSVAYGLRF